MKNKIKTTGQGRTPEQYTTSAKIFYYVVVSFAIFILVIAVVQIVKSVIQSI